MLQSISHSFDALTRVEHEKRNSISPSNHVLFSLLYKSLAEEADLIRVSERECHSFMALLVTCQQLTGHRYLRDMSKIIDTDVIETVFLRGGNPYKPLQSIKEKLEIA